MKNHTGPVHERKKPYKCKSSDHNFDLKVLAVNVHGIKNKHLHVLNLLNKNKCSLAVLSEVETTHQKAATSHMEGFCAFCPPTTVTGPPDKEVGVLMLISNNLASSAKPRPDINAMDTANCLG